MWIFLGIVGLFAAIVTVVLCSRVDVLVKSDESGGIQLLYRWMFKTYGENPDPNNPILQTLKKATGADRLEKQQMQKNVREAGLGDTVEQTMRVLADLLREVLGLLQYCTARRCRIRVVCAEAEAADTAVSYGRCCAAVYPLVGFLCSVMKVRERGLCIDLSCDYVSGREDFELDMIVSVRFFRVLAAFFRVAMQEAQRTVEQETAAQPSARPPRQER